MAYQGGYQAPPTARAAPFLPGLIVGIVGGALMILGAFLDWVSGGRDATGIDAPIEVFWDPNIDRQPENFLTSAGFVVIVLGLLVILGSALGRGGLARFGAVFGIVAVVLLIISLYRAGGNVGDLGIGVWAILVGSIVALVAGFLRVRAEPVAA